VAGEIFVGSVAVSVVPDLRGFNDRVRSELVPAANDIGREIGQSISQGIIDALDIGDIISKATLRSMDSAKADGYTLGLAYGAEMRRGIDDSLKDITAKVKLSVDESSLAKIRAVGDITGDLGGVGATDKGGKVAVDIGESRVVRLSEQLDALNRALGVGVTASGLGSGVSRGRSAANVGLQGIISTILASSAKDAAKQVAEDAARDTERAGTRAGSDAGGLAANATIMDLLRGQQLAGLGQLFSAAPPEAQLAIGGIALGSLPFAGQALAGGGIGLLGAGLAGLGIAGATGIGATKPTAGQAATAAQFTKFSTSAQADLAKIGVAFIPVMDNIFRTATSVLGRLTPVFAGAERIIAGPFQMFSDTILRSFESPQVASSIQNVAKAFGDILVALAPDIPGIVNSFADAIERIALAVQKNPKAFADFINFLFQIVIAVTNAVAFLTDFADYLEFHFTPAVGHFVDFWIDVGHDIEAAWDTTWNNTIGRTERGLHDTAALFDGWRHDVAARVMQTGADALNIWNSFWNNTVGRAIRGVQDTEHAVSRIIGVLTTWQQLNSQSARIWNILWQITVGQAVTGTRRVIQSITFFVGQVIGLFQYLGRASAAIWNQIWANTVSQAVGGYNRLTPVFRTIGNMVSNTWTGIAHISEIIWNQIWSETIGQAIRGVQSLTGVFNTIRTKVIAALSSSGQWLYGIGQNLIHGLTNGIDSAMAGIGNWIKSHVVDPIVNAVKHFFGIHSPSTVMIGIGANVMQGVVQGMLTSGGNLGNLIKNIFGGWPQALGSLVSKSMVDLAHLPAKALNALGSIAGKIGGAFGSIWHKVFGGSGGVNQWAGTVMQALAMLHLPMSLLGQVLYQMQTESGGNPNAINLTDINAQMGDPSRGLLQTIGSTFAAFHVAGTSGNIYDPLANVAAAINYALHTYGPSLMRGGMGMGSGHGYDMGGYAPPGASWFWNGTGKPEPVLSESQWNAIYSAAQGGDGGNQYHAHFDGLTGAAIESHVQTAFKAMSLTAGALNRQGRRSLCPLRQFRFRSATSTRTALTGI
jgi:Transglycosylase SLT domain